MSGDFAAPSPDNARFGPNPGKHRDDCAWTLHQHTCSCEYPRYIDALEALARDYIYVAVEGALDNDDPGWEEYPELPEFVWEDLRERVSNLVSNPSTRESTAAYRSLSKLATEEA
jgi:hypothetical protein